ncbi:MAG: NADPH:quinone oxidoreductase family protein [Alphaproteobacteria bacterium]|jgi:NADPH2:quinone reductase|nr:NADPH:quinone oxidoreductase family protein [Alphaproteobacteria bacterium]MDP6589002.1 NADPH:quinone oxidoreductase family protein [Alphaproteobacteria bacterium]MDP6816983.1 NADPH:quinone oxidoreductase family protein [Alphaproteobacteria bacterium]
MQAMICRAWGGPDQLRLEEVAPPQPAPHQLRIKILAAGVNYADTIMIEGRYQTRPDFPFAPGLEACGEVIECGAEVSRFKPGDRVMAFLRHGGFAEQAVANESDSFKVPDAMTVETAASFLIGYVSSHVAIRWQAKLEPGERLLVLGASGGVGLTAVEIGKAFGARVIAAASSAEKLEIARDRGADELIDYKRDSLKARVAEITGGEGADVCYDPVGGDLFDEALSSLAWGGRFLVIGFVGGIPQIPANRLLVKSRSAMGSSLRYYRQRRPELLVASVEELLGWWQAGKIKPLITNKFSLAEVPAAMAELLERRAIGRIVISMA